MGGRTAKRAQRIKTIRQKVFIRARPEEVYNAFMNGRVHSEFTGSKATSVPRVGGRITAWNGYITGKNLKLVKGKMIVQRWKTTEWPKGYDYSRLQLSFKPKGRGTELSMVHSSVPASQFRSYSTGWPVAYWKPLQRYFSKKKR